MDKRNAVKHFSQLIWGEIENSTERNIEYDILKDKKNSMILYEGSYEPVRRMLSHLSTDTNMEGPSTGEKNALLIIPGEKGNKCIYIENNKECNSICQKYSVKHVIIVKPHVHSLDALRLETLLYDADKDIRSYIFAYEADELNFIVDVERHVESLQLYWQIMKWFDKSKLKQEYIRNAILRNNNK